MELRHKSAAFSKILQNANGQFAAVPMNLIRRSETKTADYFVTGYWSGKAISECKYENANVVFPKVDKINSNMFIFFEILF